MKDGKFDRVLIGESGMPRHNLTDAVPSEHLEQVETVAWFRRTFPGVRIFAIPNGGHRGIREAGRLKGGGC